MDEKDNSHIGTDIEKGMRSAASTARAISSAGKAVGKAAGGNMVGAAAEVLKNESLRKFLAVLLLMSFLLTFMIFVAAPMSLYEGIKGYCETIRDRWLADYYSSNQNRAIAALTATFTGAWDIVCDIWNAATSGLPQNDVGMPDKDVMTSDDIRVLGPREALSNVYQKKIDACVDKLNARAEMLMSAVQSSAAGPASDPNTINGWVYSNLFLGRDCPYYDSLSDTHNVTYAGVHANTSTQPLSRREAVRVMSVYSAMYNCNAELIQPYALMKWLGYYSGGAPSVYFVVGDAVTCAVKGWNGDFMPMYLVEEQRENKDADYSGYQCAAADILLTVTSDSLFGLEPEVKKTEVRREELRSGYARQWRLMSADTFSTWPAYDPSCGLPYLEDMHSPYPACTSDSERWMYYRGGLDFVGMCEANAAGELMWCLVDDYCVYTETVIEYDYELSYSFNAGVSVRNAKAIYDLAGFYERPASAYG